MNKLSMLFLSLCLSIISVPAFAAWTPLITSDDFSGMQTDVLTAAGGIVSVVLVIIGLGWLVRAFVK